MLQLLFCVSVYREAHAEIVDVLSYEFYEVVASPTHRLSTSLNNASPLQKQNGAAFHGYTKWHVTWRYTTQGKSGVGCKLSSITTELKSTIVLTKLTNESASQRNIFDSYLLRLKEHELGHHEIAREAAAAVDRALTNLGTSNDCKSLQAMVDDTAKATLNLFTEKEREYDAVTMHGKTQGARLYD